MGAGDVGIEHFMRRMGDAGITVILKMDHERVAEETEPWTVVMSGPGLGEQGFIRAESSSLADCLDQCFVKLRARPGEWEWLRDVR